MWVCFCKAIIVFLIPSLTYASPAWWGFASKGDKSMLLAVLNKAIRWGLYGDKHPLELENICVTADMELFKTLLKTLIMYCTNCFRQRKCMVTILGLDLTSMFYLSKTFLRTRIFWTECCMLICIDYFVHV